MHATIRRYQLERGMGPEVARRAEAGFVPILRSIDGFAAYHLLDAGDDVGISVSLFRDREGAEESTRRAGTWVQENLAALVRSGPHVSGGDLLLHATGPDDGERIARATYDAFNRRALDEAAALIAEDAHFMDSATGETFHGPAGYVESLRRWLNAFPDGRAELSGVHGGGGWVTVEFVGKGTQTGPLHGPGGDLPPTGRAVELHFCDVLRVHGGLIREGRSYYDLAVMLRQLGLMPEPRITATM